jgi:hypothetical protein
VKLCENVVEEFYKAVARNDNAFIYSIHIPLSDVFYVREALHHQLGKRYTLDYVEWAMLKEGLLSPKHCYDADQKLSWSEYPLKKEVHV